eukprot:TRINITY_DN22991_c0_g1_i1.p1 TRINITY_DN22991_c0_g1~~TRINITY_DN22991_c0_g1_i1.p1  ORF type:complete len:772 (-),score=98.51 TRINITY_DN22991_c0_g1_i1:235-2550(-)
MAQSSFELVSGEEGQESGPEINLSKEHAWALLSMMGIKQKQRLEICEMVFLDNCTSVDPSHLLDTASVVINCSQDDIALMLEYVPVYERAFRNIDSDSSGQISTFEMMDMLRSLGIDTSSSADLMAHLDADCSGEITFFEFVEGVTNESFKRRFPQITLEMLCAKPSCLDGQKVISDAEETLATKKLPFVEKILFWVLKAMSPPKKDDADVTGGGVASKPALGRKNSRVLPVASPPVPSGQSSAGNTIWLVSVARSHPVKPVTRKEGDVPCEKMLVGRRCLGEHLEVQQSCNTNPTANLERHSNNKPKLTHAQSMIIENSCSTQKAEGAKSHILSETQRQRVKMCLWAAIFSACLAGVGAAIFADALNTYAGTLVSEEEEVVLYYTITSILSLIWSIAEMIVCCAAGFVFTVRMTKVCGIVLIPMDRERAKLAGSLARSVMELGHPQDRIFGVDPLRRSSKWCLLLNTLIYMGSRGAVKFVFKMVVKKVGPRTIVKQVQFAGLAIEIFINVIFNSLALRFAMLGASICCLGPTACVEVVGQLIRHRHEKDLKDHPGRMPTPLPDNAKWLAMRCVAVAITWKMNIHPNNRHLLNHLSMLFVDDGLISRMGKPATTTRRGATRTLENARGCCCCCRRSKVHSDDVVDKPSAGDVNACLENLQLDSEAALYNGLAQLTSANDINFVLSVLVLACIIDGSVGKPDWQCLCHCAERCGRTPNWANLEHVVNLFSNGRPMTAQALHAVFDGSQLESSAYCESLRHMYRCCMNSLNFF